MVRDEETIRLLYTMQLEFVEPNTPPELETGDLSPLDHELNPHFEHLASLSSTAELLRDQVFRSIQPEVERVLNSVESGCFSDLPGEGDADDHPRILATAWNIERGIRLDGIIPTLQHHPVLRRSEVLLLTELDYGMARTGNVFVARDLARALKMNYAFAPCYINLNKGSGLEARAEGENGQALHGNAILARYPLRRPHSIVLPNGKDKMRGKEKRLGSQRVVVADLAHPLGEVRVVSLHLDAHSTQLHRRLQMKIVLDHLESLEPKLPVLLGGDWNTTTYNSKRATYAIAGFARRVMMGVGYFVTQHYPHPYRWFERHLFRELESRSYDFRGINEMGVGTLHYDVRDLSHNTNLQDWVPRWCFWFMEKALEKQNGRASLKLDWFAAQGLAPDESFPPKVIGGLADEKGPLSDHDAIVVGLKIRQ
jgi:endonuclease/exonuclease/phosphatase family metal-dependent hydrolase